MILSGVGVVKHFGLNCNYDGCNFTPWFLKLALQGGDKLLSYNKLHRCEIQCQQSYNILYRYSIEVFWYIYCIDLSWIAIYCFYNMILDTSSVTQISITNLRLLPWFRREIESCFYLKETKNVNIWMQNNLANSFFLFFWE